MLQSPCRSRVSPRSSIHCARARPFVCSCADRSGSAASACGRPLEPVVSVKVVNLPAGSALSRAPRSHPLRRGTPGGSRLDQDHPLVRMMLNSAIFESGSMFAVGASILQVSIFCAAGDSPLSNLS